ncbi:hypothetical protein CDD82_2026 [Ophiocordyceps australis]|uniref:Calponin-homology (CH) domain-containing protein n=1 Tax=Ophiocordyceps australis TaxID=1399860 RepID=A0A2C5XGW5_9HYPO|nr:hypothetical protein CDD82_2026 [Ophiocordyceps australis]
MHDARSVFKADEQLVDPASPTVSPTAMAMGTRCVSTASSASHGSRSDAAPRDSLGSDLSSRHSSASYLSRQSDVSSGSQPRRRGYVRPQGTDFAASARSRESVMSLGSIAHLQYYFARTGLLDGKGAQLARRKHGHRATLDMALLDATAHDTRTAAHLPSSPAGNASACPDGLDPAYDDSNEESFAESDPGMLPPTVSTYNHREPHVPKPPTIAQLKTDLQRALDDAARALREVQQQNQQNQHHHYQQQHQQQQQQQQGQQDHHQQQQQHHQHHHQSPNHPVPPDKSPGWHEVQGMHILDVVTLAIRAAKMYYTAHELPDRLDAIKPEKQVRADLLAVMETLKQMATRSFKGGMRDDEVASISAWIASISHIMSRDEQIDAAERAEQASWTWLRPDAWAGRPLERERAFIVSMDPQAAASLPAWLPLDPAATQPTAFLRCMQTGLRLVQLHNAAVRKSRRRFGAIPVFHVDTQKPYRCADNLRYWVKAAELRFEVLLHLDVLAVVHGTDAQAWRDFEHAIVKWCRHVGDEIARDLG